jgi:hypothetical protein
MMDRTAGAIGQAINALQAAPSERSETRTFAERLGWDETVRKQLLLYDRVVSA